MSKWTLMRPKISPSPISVWPGSGYCNDDIQRLFTTPTGPVSAQENESGSEAVYLPWRSELLMLQVGLHAEGSSEDLLSLSLLVNVCNIPEQIFRRKGSAEACD